MDLRKVKKLIELVEESDIEELEVVSGDESVRIVLPRHGAGAHSASVISNVSGMQRVPAAHTPPAVDAAIIVSAPMAGTFYHAPHPDAEPFVQVGQQVQAGDVMCIIESMKMMHEIRASQGGVVAQVCVNNAQPVGTGDALFKLS